MQGLVINQAIPALKPIKRGFKDWCRADSANGYVNNFVVYTGKSDDGPAKNLGYKVVMEICRNILGKRIP